MNQIRSLRLTRRELLELAAMAGAATLLGGVGGSVGLRPSRALAGEDYPTSPLILDPFRDPLPIPSALAPVPLSEVATWSRRPGPGAGQQSSDGGTHQLWSSQLGLPDPVVYRMPLRVGGHSFTTSRVLPIDSGGAPTISFDAQGNVHPAGTTRTLPLSTIYGFDGSSGPTFPGPRINAEYGRPVLVRFENHLDENPENYDRQDFGSPEYGFLTHLHNGHTACESDGNPHYKHLGYHPGEWVDDLYLNYPPSGDDREKQSFFWFHDHYHGHTGANVYKGMVGPYPIYDPTHGFDMGDEHQGLRLPGVRTNNPNGSFDVEYDIPLAIYDCLLDDGVVGHEDAHGGTGQAHPEWWGKSFFKHYPNQGFVGDIFTVNGVAYPVLEVKRRKYRLRFLDASIARIYNLQLMSSAQGPKAARDLGYGGDELQGQYRLPDGQRCMRLVQVATDGGLLSAPIVRDSFELWPAKRREFIVDFTKYMDGTPTTKGDVIYLVNTMKMTDGRKPDSPDPAYKIPVLKIVIGADAPDDSVIPTRLRSLPDLPTAAKLQELLANRRKFKLERGGHFGEEHQWLINGLPFEEATDIAHPRRGSYEAWEIENGGGGWVHPMHMHEEEHRVVMRNGQPVPDPNHPDDLSREDVVAVGEGESVVFIRQFRTFTGPYVTHCHNLAHEDHSMMFGWTLVP